MICIVGDRASGKTTELVRLSELTGIPIVVPSAFSVRDVERIADKMGADISRPIPSSNSSRRLRASRYGAVYVDEAQWILEDVLGVPVKVAVFDSAHVDEFTEMAIDPTTVSLWNLIRRWLSARKEGRKETGQ